MRRHEKKTDGISKADEAITREFFLGFIKIHILHHAAEGPVFGIELMEELSHHGYKLGPGTLYPTLHKLERAKYLRSSSRTVRGKIRRYYSITRRGRTMLVDAKAKIGELVREVVHHEQ